MPKFVTFKVLVWHQKHGVCYVAARDTGEELRAYLYLFGMMDSHGYYSYEGALNADEEEWYEAAKAGDGQAAKWLLDNRYDYEYERVEIEHIVVPPEVE